MLYSAWESEIVQVSIRAEVISISGIDRVESSPRETVPLSHVYFYLSNVPVVGVESKKNANMKTSGWHALRYIHAWFILNLHSYKNILALVIMNNIYRFRHTFQIIINFRFLRHIVFTIYVSRHSVHLGEQRNICIFRKEKQKRIEIWDGDSTYATMVFEI